MHGWGPPHGATKVHCHEKFQANLHTATPDTNSLPLSPLQTRYLCRYRKHPNTLFLLPHPIPPDLHLPTLQNTPFKMSHRLKLKRKVPVVEKEYCTKCGQFGHIFQNCGAGITCYKCGKVGHHGRDCTEDIQHASVAMASAREHGMLGDDFYDKKTKGANDTSHMTNWTERAKADKENEEREANAALTLSDYAARENKTYDIVPTEQEQYRLAVSEARRQRKERRRAELQHDLAELEELRAKKARLDRGETIASPPRIAKSPSPSPPPSPQRAAIPDPEAREEEPKVSREKLLLEEKKRRAEEMRRVQEEARSKEDRHLDRIVRNKMKQQADHYTPPEWAGRRTDVTLIIAVQKDGQTVETLDISAHPYYLLGKSEAVVDFPQAHPSVSRVHLAVVHNPQKNETFLQDLGSQWGTKVGGNKIEAKAFHKWTLNTPVQIGASTRIFTLKQKSEW